MILTKLVFPVSILLSLLLFAHCTSPTKTDVFGDGVEGNIRSQMISLTGGTFQMGDSLYAVPVHSVTVSDFKICNTEVTQAQFKQIMGVNPSIFNLDTNRPVENVTWFDAVLYCNALSKTENKDTVYTYNSIFGTPGTGNGCLSLTELEIDFNKDGYRLPTEAEWEYACRGGTSTGWYWTNTWDQTTANNYCWNSYNSGMTTQPVAQKIENGFGLYDMAGNVWEWCSDSLIRSVGSSSVHYRVLRGGSWHNSGDVNFRSGCRSNDFPYTSLYVYGFRVVCK
jgi:formylglycine-generating enzyme required for sulfatase activity